MAEENLIIEGEEFTCPSLTKAYYVGKKPWGSAYGNLKVYIPTLMLESKIPKGVAGTLKPFNINKSIFCNATDCAITPMTKVVPQNYVTAKTYGNIEFQMPHLNFDAEIEVRGNDHDFQSVSITTNKDPSTYHSK